MNYALVTISIFSIAIPAITGGIRAGKVEKVFYPFLILIWIGCINETLNFFILRGGYTNTVNSNIYSLAECFMIVLFFKRLGLFGKRGRAFFWIIGLFFIGWLLDNFILSASGFSSYFTIASSFSYVLMSITMINRMVVAGTRALVRNAIFLICMGFITFFTCAVIVEIFWIYGLDESDSFLLHVYLINTDVNIAVNLIYALAILWMPKKREYTLL